MAWVGSPAQSQMSLFLEYPFSRKLVVVSLKKKKNTAAVKHDMTSSDWLKLAALCLFRVQRVPKKKSICDCAWWRFSVKQRK